MRTIPKAALSVVQASSTDSTRPALQSVLIEETTKDGVKGIRTTSTDGKILARYESHNDQSNDFPSIPAMELAENSTLSAVIRADDVKRLQTAIPKGRHVVNAALVKFGKDISTFASSSSSVMQVKNRDTVFPLTGGVLERKDPTLKIPFATELLFRALKIAKDVTNDGYVTLEFTNAASPVRITSDNKDGALTLVVMPVSKYGDRPVSPSDHLHDLADGIRESIKLTKLIKNKSPEIVGRIARLARIYKGYIDACKAVG